MAASVVQPPEGVERGSQSPIVGAWPEGSLELWLESQGLSLVTAERLTGDVSLRQYYRLGLEPEPAVLAFYPPALRGGCERFLATTVLLEELEVPVPRVLAADCSRGFMVLEDVGDRTLAMVGETGEWETLLPLYERAAGYAGAIAGCAAAAVRDLNPPLDAPLLRWELEKSVRLVLEPEGLLGPRPAATVRCLDALCRALGEEMVLCHRDYMPRNLILDRDRLVVLDHQDLRIGPRCYDLASLLNDSLFPPPAVEERILADALRGDSERLAYRRAVVQRSLKAVGNYREFAQRGFRRHLPLVAPTLRRALRFFDDIPELAPIARELGVLWPERLSLLESSRRDSHG